MLIELIEIFQGGFNRVRLLHAIGYRLKSFVTVTGDANDDRFVTRNSSFLDQLPGYRDFASSRRLGKYSFSPCEQLDPSTISSSVTLSPQPPTLGLRAPRSSRLPDCQSSSNSQSCWALPALSNPCPDEER
jgi:hypothetical protein